MSHLESVVIIFSLEIKMKVVIDAYMSQMALQTVLLTVNQAKKSRGKKLVALRGS
jgi:hypothetical protein